MGLVVGSDARLVSPVFTDLDESPSAADSTPTVTVTSVTRGALATPTATAHPGRGYYRVTLTADDHLDVIDRLTVTWSAEVDNAVRVLTQTVDVSGGVYVPTDHLAGLRTVPDTAVEMDAVRAWRDAFEMLAEEARGVAYVPRIAVEDHPGCSPVLLGHKQPRELLAVWVDGVERDVDGFTLDASRGHVTGPASGAVVRVAYSHGYDAPPPPLVAACREYVRAKILADTSDMQRAVLSYTNLASGEVYRYGTSDWNAGRFTGMAVVDDLIAQVHDERVRFA